MIATGQEGRARAVTIDHNPACDTLAMIRASGEEPVVVEYLANPPSRDRLRELIAAMGTTRATSCAGKVRLMPSWGSTTRR